jgi:hypothetical protein
VLNAPSGLIMCGRDRNRGRSLELLSDPWVSVWTGCVVFDGWKAAVAARRLLQVVHCEEVLAGVGVEAR